MVHRDESRMLHSDDEEVAQVPDFEQRKVYTVEAAQERLDRLDKNIRQAFTNNSETSIINCIINDLRNKLDANVKPYTPPHYHFLQIVYDRLQIFLSRVLKPEPDEVFFVDSALEKFISAEVDPLVLVQYLCDIFHVIYETHNSELRAEDDQELLQEQRETLRDEKYNYLRYVRLHKKIMGKDGGNKSRNGGPTRFNSNDNRQNGNGRFESRSNYSGRDQHNSDRQSPPYDNRQHPSRQSNFNQSGQYNRSNQSNQSNQSNRGGNRQTRYNDRYNDRQNNHNDRSTQHDDRQQSYNDRQRSYNDRPQYDRQSKPHTDSQPYTKSNQRGNFNSHDRDDTNDNRSKFNDRAYQHNNDRQNYVKRQTH